MAELIKPSRRGFLFGAAAFLAAPAIVRVASLMPVSVPKPAFDLGSQGFDVTYDQIHLTGARFLEPGTIICISSPATIDWKEFRVLDSDESGTWLTADLAKF
jgi:hypothetical protein